MFIPSLGRFVGFVIMLLALFTVQLAVAQTDTIRGPFDEIYALYSELDPTVMPEGALFQSATPLVKLSHFTGHHDPAETNRLDVNSFGAALFTAASTVRDTNQSAVFDLGYRDHYAGTATNERVSLTGMLMAGGLLTNDAVINGLVGPSNDSTQIIAGPAYSAAAYQRDSIFFFAPTVGKLGGPSVTWQFTDSLFYGNISWPAQLEFDPGDGQGYRTLSFGDSLQVDYSGLEHIELALRFSANNTSYRAYAKTSIAPQARRMMDGPEVITDVAGTTIEVEWADPDCQREFTNTIIVVDGFDPTEQQAVVFQNEQRTGAYDKYTEFRFDGTPVADHLKEKGWDFAFVNFDNGGQSTKDAAQILKNVIRYINARRDAADIGGQNIVIGHSMGGITSKWALSEMAKYNEDHNVIKFFSFDTPFQGATVPLGIQLSLQYLLGLEIRAGQETQFLREISPQFNAASAAFESPAAKELLLFRALVTSFIRVQFGNGSNPRYEVTIDTESHLNFRELVQDLHPLDVPHIAIANGSRFTDQLTGTSEPENSIEPSGLYYHLAIDDDTGELDGWGDDISKVVFKHNSYAEVFPDAMRNNTRVNAKIIGVAWVRRGIGESSSHADFGLPRYDLAPSSHGDDGFSDLLRAANDDISTPQTGTDTNQVLQVTIPIDHYAFVQTSSALDLPLTLFPPVNGCGPGVTECITPDPDFIGSRFLETGTRNYEHVSFTPTIAEALLDRIPSTQLSEWATNTGVPEVTELYNFGAAIPEQEATDTYLAGIRTVSGAGAFWVNKSDRIAYVNNSNNPQNTASTFAITLGGRYCNLEETDITLQSGTEIIVGQNEFKTATLTALEESRVTVENGAFFEVRNGSKAYILSSGFPSNDGNPIDPTDNGGLVIRTGGLLHVKGPQYTSGGGGQLIVDGGTIRIKAGGQLRISYDAQVIARNGGRIILEDGAIVQLWSGGVDEGEGTVWIQDGGELVIEGEYTFSGSGYWQFDEGNEISGDGDLVIEGDGKQFRRMKVNKSAQVFLSRGQDFVVENAKVEYDFGSNVTVNEGSGFDVNNATFSGPATAAINTDGTARSSVDNSEFLNNEKGVSLRQDGPLSAIHINSSLFQSSTEIGVNFGGFSPDNFGRTPVINGCTFSGCTKGVNIDNLLAVNISNSTFTSSEAYQFAIYGQDCESLSVRECTVSGYETTLTSNSQEGAVELEYVTARFSGGQYTANTVAIHDQSGSTLTFDDCVEVSANCFGIATSEVQGEITTLALNGMTLINNSNGIHGGSGIVTSGGINTFQIPTSSNCDYAATPRLIDMDVNQMADPSITLNNNHWLDPLGMTLTAPPVQNDWFCIVNGPTNWCNATFIISTNNIQPQGCGSAGPCESPKTCEYYCQIYPNDPACFNDGGGLPGFTATPNPSGGIVALSQLPEEGGTLNIFDARGALMKVIQLDESTSQIINLKELPAGMYTLQLLNESNPQQEAVRLMISK